MAGICRNYHESSDSFEYQKKSLLKSSFPKILVKIFQPKKIPKFKISHPKNLRSSLSLEIWSNPTGMPVEHISFLDAITHYGSAVQEFLWMLVSAEMNKWGFL